MLCLFEYIHEKITDFEMKCYFKKKKIQKNFLFILKMKLNNNKSINKRVILVQSQ